MTTEPRYEPDLLTALEDWFLAQTVPTRIAAAVVGTAALCIAISVVLLGLAVAIHRSGVIS